jgi:hypothetical protein
MFVKIALKQSQSDWFTDENHFYDCSKDIQVNKSFDLFFKNTKLSNMKKSKSNLRWFCIYRPLSDERSWGLMHRGFYVDNICRKA